MVSISVLAGDFAAAEVWFPLPEYRMVTCMEVAPEEKLQRCWREQRTGKCEWRTVKTVLLTNREYHQDKVSVE